MKGIVLNLLNEMVEEKFGFETWDTIVDKAGSNGIFVAGQTYADEEFLGLIAAGADIAQIDANEFVRDFGIYMLPAFAQNYPMFFQDQTDLKSFLLTVDQVIHVEVRKLDPKASLPEFRYRDEDDDELTMLYSSPRKLCRLAEGLIHGAALHFRQEYELNHSVCMHNGYDHCELNLVFG